MPKENDPALSTVAATPRLHDEANAPAGQGLMPSELPPEPDILPVQPGEHLSAAQLQALLGGTEASSAHDLDVWEDVQEDVQEGVDHNPE
ncbi:hypothetical protein [Deinococcus sp.]|uniref:hypothetical protein n=1 Tax=Deinococcus sp. TaxID=47478 RepID=UPI0025DF3004|nr:hypothetical protein [Deinococcus sp.]